MGGTETSYLHRRDHDHEAAANTADPKEDFLVVAFSIDHGLDKPQIEQKVCACVPPI